MIPPVRRKGSEMQVPGARCEVSDNLTPGTWNLLLDHRRDQLGEAVPGAVQAALHRAQVAARDLRDLLAALPFELAQHEHDPVMLRQVAGALLPGVLDEAVAVQGDGAGARVIELRRPVAAR